MAGARALMGKMLLLCALLLHGGCGDASRNPDLTIAVATNFLDTAEVLADVYGREYDVKVTLVSGSTGKLYAQIVNGAPFDVFLAADASRPLRLEELGQAVAQSGLTYATGRLVLWSPDPDRIRDDGAAILSGGNVRRLAIANPALAPYGAAAREVLERLGVWQAFAPRLVMGENVGQAFALVATGNAELGLVALANVTSPATMNKGSRWEVPADLHAPIAQRAVLLQRASGNAVAHEFMEFLQSPSAREMIQKAGYVIE